MQNKPKRKSVSFKKALVVPLFLCILTFLVPGIKSSFVWIEEINLDYFFAYYPQICALTGNKEEIKSPTTIITKDQSFQEKFKRNLNREDFAKLLEIIKKQGVKVAALDFIFDEASNNDEYDRKFAEQLKQFPYPILAHSFRNRGQQNFSLVDLKDANADRPSGLISLYRPILENSLTTGIINIPSDFDSTIRLAPLAFHPDESELFLPTLGFSTWIVSLLCEKEDDINRIDLSGVKDISEALEIYDNNAPFIFYTTGHEGLDKCILEQETMFLFKKIVKNHPELKPKDYKVIFDLVFKRRVSKNKTWIRLPKEPLPLVGTYHTPCIRLPYQKLPPPLKGDGIETISISRLINKEEDVNSVFIFDKNKFTISSEEPYQRILPEIPNQKAGNNCLIGEIKNVIGKSISNATVWAIMPQTGYWEKTTSNNEGKYILNNLPKGDYIIIVFVNTTNGCDKAMMNVKLSQQKQTLPLLIFANNINSMHIPSKLLPRSQEADLWVYGKIIPMLNSDNDGITGTNFLPNGYSLTSLSENEKDTKKVFSISEDGKLLLNGKTSSNNTVAVMQDNNNWQLRFYRKISLNKKNDSILNGLPPSLEAIINITSKSSLITKQYNQDIIIKPEQPINIERLPISSLDLTKQINLKLNFPKSKTNDGKVILLSDFGKEFILNNNSNIIIPSGDYFILTDKENARGIHKQDTINKKVVFIGSSLPADQDFIVAPINFLDRNFNRMPGVHVHANLFSALYKNRFFYALPFHMDRAPKYWPIYQFLMVFPIFILLNNRIKSAITIKNTLSILVIAITIFLSALFLFSYRILIPIYYPSILIILFGVARSFVEWINSRKQALATQNAFSRFISADIVKQIVNNPDAIRPGGEKKELTIMFTDIAGFTSISEKLDADDLTVFINNYLDEMTKILFKNGGTLDKYIGDAIMGFWNHPTSHEDHATKAVACAIEMQKKLKEMREKWIAQGLPKVEMRAGINTGTCMVGFVGSKIQMNFTCLGDNVNLASRLEGANKAYGTFIMISQSVKEKLKPNLFSIRFLDFLAVKGKNEPVLVYEVRCWLDEETDIWKDKAGSIYHKGIDKYLTREWDESISLFEQVLKLVPDDAPSKVYIDRCKHFKLEPPEKNWDGRFILKTK